jgi:hypothetical protein
MERFPKNTTNQNIQHGITTMTNSRKRITNYSDCIALDGFDYPDEAINHVSTVDTSKLKRVLDIVEKLGWHEVDVYAIEDWANDSDRNPIVAIQPRGTNIWDEEQAAVTLAPLETDGE